MTDNDGLNKGGLCLRCRRLYFFTTVDGVFQPESRDRRRAINVFLGSSLGILPLNLLRLSLVPDSASPLYSGPADQKGWVKEPTTLSMGSVSNQVH